VLKALINSMGFVEVSNQLADSSLQGIAKLVENVLLMHFTRCACAYRESLSQGTSVSIIYHVMKHGSITQVTHSNSLGTMLP
jgi:hypothetical protein